MEKTLQNLGVTELNEMQIEAIKSIEADGDTLLLSPTGSGKTLAFLLPLLKLLKPETGKVQVIVLVPTRELSLQIESVWKKISVEHKVNAFYGGHSMEVETNSLSEPPTLLVGTPGRIADHFTRRTFDGSEVHTLIFDEFDKSLEMGFQEQMQYIFTNLPNVTKRIFVSATQRIAIPDFVTVNKLTTLDYIEAKVLAQNISFRYIRTQEKTKALVSLLGQISASPTLIFCNLRDEVEELANAMQKKGINSSIFHGKIEQMEREKALIRFRNGSSRYLISTDLAARGLDIPEVEHVIHYALPHHEQEFVHRNGRTARMNATGTAYFFVDLKGNTPPYIKDLPKEFVIENNHLLPAAEEWDTVYFSGGKKDKISKMDIVGFCIQKGKLEKDQIGKIEVKDFASYVAIKNKAIPGFLKNIDNEKIKGRKMKIELAR
ncbi:DEAD/DEAH box helicase [Lacihabitans lacunae]|uniref:DEAD/DEAH box helicase n=1 Tax=Lacihabitans lacunae TaxID=1028214 RepID=A0ABV7Z0U9_9BACT